MWQKARIIESQDNPASIGKEIWVIPHIVRDDELSGPWYSERAQGWFAGTDTGEKMIESNLYVEPDLTVYLRLAACELLPEFAPYVDLVSIESWLHETPNLSR